MAKIILEAKNLGYFEVFKDLGKIIGENLLKLDLKNFSLAYVPLTKRKLLSRGFNQAEVLAKEISHLTQLPLFNGLIKIKETKDQTELNYEQRKINLKDAFELKFNPPAHIILIDDIKTTGSTLLEIAHLLKKQGTKEIIALTVLR